MIVGERVPEQLEMMARSSGAELARLYAEYLEGRPKTVRTFDVGYADLCFFGGTANNLREFTFLLKVLDEHSIRYSHKFFLRDFRAHTSRIASAVETVRTEVLHAGVQWVHRCGTVSGSHLNQLLQYTGIFLGVLHSYADKRHLLPRIAVVANDHSPSQVGFAMAMKSLGVPVIYVQHAEVSEIFPPLDFTASVLRNQRSLDTYRRVGPVKGKTFVVSRIFDKARFQDVMAPLTGEAIVGIYPTSRFDRADLQVAIESLRRNPAVQDYFVKLHPNTPLTFNEEEATYFKFRTNTPDARHVAIVGNSSVVVELLSQGHPVYQLFDLDGVDADYYGFVKAGFAPSIEPGDLEKSFWTGGFYNEDWLKRGSRFEPSMREDQWAARRKLARFMARLLKRRAMAQALHQLFRVKQKAASAGVV
ncbi:hypothetical protein [Microvirga sp. TS319]|uniref:hypothetical protein n=1 Tax=Microvirga sp. TS319 TaxID=3241165 RepID=UPI00351A0FE1